MAKRKQRKTQVDEPAKEVITEDSQEKPVEEEPKTEEAVEAKAEQPSEELVSEPEVQTVELVYLGTSEKATVKGAVTGERYEFYKDEYNMPSPTTVDERDSSAILALIGKACCGKKPTQLFMKKVDWDLEIESAKKSNR